jgi:hypothetical protein
VALNLLMAVAMLILASSKMAILGQAAALLCESLCICRAATSSAVCLKPRNKLEHILLQWLDDNTAGVLSGSVDTACSLKELQ